MSFSKALIVLIYLECVEKGFGSFLPGWRGGEVFLPNQGIAEN